MDQAVRTSILFMAFVVGGLVLYWLRDILAPFALAIFLWLIIDGFARWLDDKLVFLPYAATLTIAAILVVAGLSGIAGIITDTALDIAHSAPDYEKRLGEIVNPLIERFSDEGWSGLSANLNLNDGLVKLLGGVGATVQSLIANSAFIVIYVVFLFAAQNSFPKKINALFPDPKRRERAVAIGERIRFSIEKYLGVQTVMSLIMTALSYGVMRAYGLDNALFWALIIFILNYIPVVGSVLAGILPALFALVQFDSLTMVASMAALLFVIQFVISNTLQPKMMGDSMNLSALVVIMSLVLWQNLWGGVGAFLSAPLTVILMIILAQFPTTHWIAVLLSADGDPDYDPNKKAGKSPTPSM